MKRFSILILSLAAAACAPEPATSSLPADFTALVPADAFALMQLRSVRELSDASEAFRNTDNAGAGAQTAEQMMAEMRRAFGLPDAVGMIDLDRPVGMALSRGNSVLEPVGTFIFPTTNPQGFMGFLAGIMPGSSTIAQGDYVAVRVGKGTATAGGGSPLIAKFPPGLMSARADLTSILAAYRPLIDMGIASFEKELETELAQESGMPDSLRPMMEWYVEMFRGVLDSAERLDVTADLSDMRVAFGIILHNRAGSMLAKIGRTERVDYGELAARLDPNAAAQMVSCYSQAEMISRFSGLYDEMAQDLADDAGLLPEMTALTVDYFKTMKEVMPMFGREMVLSYDYRTDGLRVSADVGAPDPAALAGRLTAFFRSASLAACGFAASAETRGELGGQEAVVWRQTVNEEKFLQAVPSADSAAAGVLKAILGGDGLEVAMMPSPDRLRMVAGGDTDWRTATARRLAGTATADADLLRELAPLEGANPGMFMRLDLAAIFRIVGDLIAVGAIDQTEVEALGPLASDIKKEHLPCHFYWGVKGPTIIAGGGADLNALVRVFGSQSQR